jgi:hypothetical protein
MKQVQSLKTSGRPKHVVLWGAWYGSKNVGDQALLLAITRISDLVGDIPSSPNNERMSVCGSQSVRIEVLQSLVELRKVVSRFAMPSSRFGGGVPFFDAHGSCA